MANTYAPPKSTRNPLVPIVGALALTAIIFLVLPFLQNLSPINPRVSLSLDDPPSPPPPPPVPPDPPKPEKAVEKPEPVPEIQQKHFPPIPPDAVLNPGMGGVRSGGLATNLPTVEVPPSGPEIFDVVDQDAAPRSMLGEPRTGERTAVTAVLTFVVNADGSVGEIENIEKMSHPDLRRVISDWVKRWKFDPAIKDGKPVAQRVRQMVQINPPQR